MVVTRAPVPRYSGKQIFLGTEKPGSISAVPKTALNRSSMTNFDIKDHICAACLGPTASTRNESMSSAPLRTFSTPEVSLKGLA